MSYLIEHTDFHFGIPELITMLVMLGIIILVCVKLKKLKEAKEQMEAEFAGMNVSDALKTDTADKAEPETEPADSK